MSLSCRFGPRAPVAEPLLEGAPFRGALAMSSGNLISYSAFFEWCERQGLSGDRTVAEAFGRTPQTVRNWKRNVSGKTGAVPPLHLSLACAGYEATKRADADPIGDVSIGWFQVWRHAHGLGTLEATGEAFGLTRQAVHNWHKRDRLPRWLALACLGYEERSRQARIPVSA